jgi:hypothetical protein
MPDPATGPIIPHFNGCLVSRLQGCAMDQNDPAWDDDTIIERRELRFSAGALRRIIGGLLATAPSHGLPSAAPVEVTLRPVENRVDVVYGRAEAARPIPLQVDALGALLIAYCIRARIPLRRVARKEVRVGPLYVTLMFYVEHPQVPAQKITEMSFSRQGPAR